MSYSSSGTRSRAAAETPPASLTCPPWTSSPPRLSTAGTGAGRSTKYVREKQQDVKLRQNTTRASTSMSQHSKDVNMYVTEQKGRQQLCHRTEKTSTVMSQNKTSTIMSEHSLDANTYVIELQGRQQGRPFISLTSQMSYIITSQNKQGKKRTRPTCPFHLDYSPLLLPPFTSEYTPLRSSWRTVVMEGGGGFGSGR